MQSLFTASLVEREEVKDLIEAPINSEYKVLRVSY